MKNSSRLVIVTGATSGIGYSIAQHLHQEGYALVLVGRSTEKVESLQKKFTDPQSVWTVTTDLAKPDQIKKIFTDNSIPWQNLYGLVNCAGVAVGSDIFSLSLEDWQQDIAVNLTAPFLLTQHVVNILKEQKHGGSIVNISSLAGVGGAKKPNYAASKAGLLGLTKATALRAGKYGIRANAIYPGAIDTPMIADWDEEKRNMITSTTPLGRIGQPIDIAKIVSWLLSDDSAFVTGAAINATGGEYLGQ